MVEYLCRDEPSASAAGGSLASVGSWSPALGSTANEREQLLLELVLTLEHSYFGRDLQPAPAPPTPPTAPTAHTARPTEPTGPPLSALSAQHNTFSSYCISTGRIPISQPADATDPCTPSVAIATGPLSNSLNIHSPLPLPLSLPPKPPLLPEETAILLMAERAKLYAHKQNLLILLLPSCLGFLNFSSLFSNASCFLVIEFVNTYMRKLDHMIKCSGVI